MTDVSLPMHHTVSSRNPALEKSAQPMDETRIMAAREEQVQTERFDNQKYRDEKERERLKQDADKLFESLNTGLALKFHEKSGQWYAVIENKITHEVIKEVPPQDVLELRARLKEMIGFFLDQKI
ncbi:flagellar protein FlaG [Aneurinibacillus thermoaerophilus]|uniref:flagellar protein FlaG n=1 Tax=Aneurinibacillus thermoaerophilus TaxID=143495 RepID=UPI002E1EFF39|nr:flagellar protein FlaG [Aneurinibacillus thermoaerophilus]MED0765276.1 flagellar protein FlaG [Aneurinibacillus thermoaerophilus]